MGCDLFGGRHDLGGMGQMVQSGGRLCYTPGDCSVVAGHKTKRSDPAVVPVLVTLGARSGRHTTLAKVPTMGKRTRGPDPSDRQTRDSGVNITPLASSGPVTTTPAVA